MNVGKRKHHMPENRKRVVDALLLGSSHKKIGIDLGLSLGTVAGMVRRWRKAGCPDVSEWGNVEATKIRPPRPSQIVDRSKPWLPVAGSKMKTILQVEKNECRWPLYYHAGRWEEKMFCGAPSTGSYCKHHSAMSDNPNPVKR